MRLVSRIAVAGLVLAAFFVGGVGMVLASVSYINRSPPRWEWPYILPFAASLVGATAAKFLLVDARRCSLVAVTLGAWCGFVAGYGALRGLHHLGSGVAKNDAVEIGCILAGVFFGALAGTWWRGARGRRSA